MNTPARRPPTNDSAAPAEEGVAAASRWESVRVAPRATGLAQGLRIAACGLAIAGDRVLAGLADPFRGVEARRRSREARRERALRWLVATLGALKGAFAKAGQFAAVRHDLFPQEVDDGPRKTLRDRVPPHARFRVFASTLEAELGAPLESLFSRVRSGHQWGRHPWPRSTAARLKSGQRVAVKVQYPWLRASLPADLALVRCAAAPLVPAARRAVDIGQTVRRIRQSGLAERTRFRAGGADRGRDRREPRGTIPTGGRARARSTATRRARVLTMNWHPAIPISDHGGGFSEAGSRHAAPSWRRSPGPTPNRSSSTASSTPTLTRATCW